MLTINRIKTTTLDGWSYRSPKDGSEIHDCNLESLITYAKQIGHLPFGERIRVVNAFRADVPLEKERAVSWTFPEFLEAKSKYNLAESVRRHWLTRHTSRDFHAMAEDMDRRGYAPENVRPTKEAARLREEFELFLVV